MARKQNPVASRKTNAPSPSLFSRSQDEEPQEPQEPIVPRSKRTYYLPEDVVIGLGELQSREHRRTKVKPDLSDLVAEALREYIDQRLPQQDAS